MKKHHDILVKLKNGNPLLNSIKVVANNKILKTGFATLALLFFVITSISAANKTSTTSGNWNVGSTWVGGTVPVAGDNITIASGHIVTVPNGYTTPNYGTLTTNGGTLINAGTATFTGAVTIGSTATAKISNTGTLNFNSTSSFAFGSSITNSGTINFVGAMSYSGTTTVPSATITNNIGGVINFTANNTLATTGTAIFNNGTINYAANWITNAQTNVYNYGYITVGGTLTSTASLKNYGKLTITGDATFNSDVASLNYNYCTIIANGNFTNNCANFKNYGYVFSTTAAKKITNSATGKYYQDAGGITVGVNFDNSGIVTGAGNYYFTGVTRSLAGTFGNDNNGINFYDSGLPALIMDVQTVAPHASVTKISFTPPVSSSLVTGCVIAANIPPLANDDFYITTSGVVVGGNVLTNDIDPNFGDITRVMGTLIASPQHAGLFSFNPDGSYTYTSVAGYVGYDMFAYVVCDNGVPNKCDTAVVTITVNGNIAVNPTCGNPGRDGVGTITTIPNTFWPGTANANAGQKNITLGGYNAAGSNVSIAAGDMVMIIQIQGADINSSNSDAYGDGLTGQDGSGFLFNTNLSAGYIEYGIATNAIPAGAGPYTLTLADNLVNTYVNSNYVAGVSGQRRFQVIRVPQYASLKLNADITVPAWNGTTGGIFAVTVAGAMDFNSKKIDAKGKGFRGGGGRVLSGVGTGANTDFVSTTANNTNGQKGEGIAGTPQYVNNAGALLNTTFEGYPGGSSAQGAPGNAGGGGTDGTNNNDQNSGGGGGGNGGKGGKGGNAWSSALPIGGEPGAYFIPISPKRITFGGGGGAGCTNDGTGTPVSGFASSGAAGGGIVAIFAKSLNANPGSIDVSGADANSTVAQDASGGGGAGGSALIVSNSPLTSITIIAKGGNGGTNTGGGIPHGPGGGGGGGGVYSNTNLNASSSVAGGLCGTTCPLTPTVFGASNGTSGKIKSALNKWDLPPGFMGCYNGIVAANDNNATLINTAVSGDVLVNDLDVEGDNISFLGFYDTTSVNYITSGSITISGIDLSGVYVANAGSLSINASGTYTFTPAAGFVGTARVKYQIADNNSKQAFSIAQLNIEVGVKDLCNTNDLIQMSDQLLTFMASPISGNVLSNDNDPENEGITFSGIEDPANTSNYITTGTINSIPGVDIYGDSFIDAGNITIATNGAYTFTPTSNSNFAGYVTFKYKTCDNHTPSRCKYSDLKIDVEPIPVGSTNKDPFAQDNFGYTAINTTLNGSSLLSNAVDADADVLSINTTPITAPAHGLLTINPTGTYIYTPTAAYSGPDKFIYEICDNGTPSKCHKATCYILINPSPSNNPALTTDATAVCDGQSTNINVPTGNDGYTYQIRKSDNSPVGTSFVGDGTTFIRSTGALSASETYHVTISNGSCSYDGTTTVTVNVNAVPSIPSASATTQPTCSVATGIITITAPTAIGMTYSIDGTTYTNTTGIFSSVTHGTYNVTAKNADDCISSSASVTIDAQPVTPDAPTGDASQSFCKVDMPKISDLVVVGSNIQWYDANIGGSLLNSTDLLQNNINYYALQTANGCISDRLLVKAELTYCNPLLATNDLANVNEDVILYGTTVLANDGDLDGSTLTVNTTPTANVSHGTLTLNADGTYTYTPTSNYNGTDSFIYQVCNDETPQECTTATVTITVNSVNDAPVANDDNGAGLTEDGANGTVNILSNDTDADGNPTAPTNGAGQFTVDLDPSTAGIQTSVTNTTGAWTYNTTTGVVTFDPANNYNGTAVLTYELCDPTAICDQANITFVVSAVNDAPVANDDNGAGLTEDGANGTINILSNDTDADGNPTAPTNGAGQFTVDLDPSTAGIQTTLTDATGVWSYDATTGIVTFDPANDYNGTAVIPYNLCDPPGECDQADITFMVSAVNDAPVANDDNGAGLTEDGANGTVNILSNDTDGDGNPTAPTNGAGLFSVDLNTTLAGIQTTLTNATGVWSYDATTGIVTFDPADNYNGTAVIPYNLCDPSGACDLANITFVVSAVNDAPVANDDNGAGLTEDGVNGTVNILTNDTDVDGNPTAPTNGADQFSIDLNTSLAGIQTTLTNATGVWNYDAATGVVTFDPANDYNGTAVIPYNLCDPSGACDLANITFVVSAVNDAPVANDDNGAGLTEDGANGTVNILSNDTDTDGNPTAPTNGAGQFSVDLDPSTAGIQTSVTNATGTWTYNTATGIVTFDPANNYNGTAVIPYNLCDPSGECDLANITFVVSAVNDAPVANDDNGAGLTEDGANGTINILSNDTDGDGNPTAPTNGAGQFTVDLDPSTAGIQTSVTNATGTWTYNTTTGVVTFDPANNYNGTAVLAYELCDPTAICDQATITFVVSSVNDAPVANDDNGAGLTEDGANGTVNILTNDTDADGNPTAPTNGAGQFTVDLDPSTAGIQTSVTNTTGTFGHIIQQPV